MRTVSSFPDPSTATGAQMMTAILAHSRLAIEEMSALRLPLWDDPGRAVVLGPICELCSLDFGFRLQPVMGAASLRSAFLFP